MATRTIVTSQPDVACDVCERRLLRGEQPDVFLAAGRRRIVCELCAPRAAYEGWLRESETSSLSLPPSRARRGRSFLERLSVPFRVRPADGQPTVAPDAELRTGAPAPEDAYGPFDAYAHVEHELTDAELQAGIADAAGEHAPGGWDDAEPAYAGMPAQAGTGARASALLEQAVAVFNASEFPRRVAGVARSLGAPEVNVRSAEHLPSVVRIVIAWELCWYRYEVDLGEQPLEAQVLDQGTELSELAREDRLANAAADDAGRLELVAA